MLQRFEMSIVTLCHTVDKCSHLQGVEATTFEDEKLYQAPTGSLMYAAMST